MKALLYGYYLDFKLFFEIYFGILSGLIISTFLITPSASGNSALNTALGSCLFMLPIAMMVITSNSELMKKFSFPVDRNLVALSHILLILVLPLVMLLMSCFFYLLELLLAELTLRVASNFFYSLVITKRSFLVGFAISYMAIVCITALTWMVSAWFYRHKILVGVIGGTFILALIYVDDFRQAVFELIGRLFYTPTPGLLCLKLILITLASFALGYIPIKRMEVK